MRIIMGLSCARRTLKKSVNVSLSPEILEEARKLKINIFGGFNRLCLKNFVSTNVKVVTRQ